MVMRRRLNPALLACLAVFASACTNEAQLIDGGEDGAFAFIAMVVMIVILVALLFAMDRFRKED
jgi:hypothetical protein